MSNYTLEQTDGHARAGVFHTRRGSVQTPLFFSVATRGAIKAGLTVEDLRAIQAPFVLSNTYHLALRPGTDVLDALGGLHAFMGWEGPIITDSGGFQVYSLQQKKITDAGVRFRNHLNGDELWLDAEESMRIQHSIGSDVLMTFDDCPPSFPRDEAVSKRKQQRVRDALTRTQAWAERCCQYHFARYPQTLSVTERPQLFGIVQGGCDISLRQQSLEGLLQLPFDGYAMGGLAVGEPPEDMYRVLSATMPLLPVEKPHYLMGVGTPRDLLECIARGVDMFDCVMPMRNARHGTLFTDAGVLKVTAARYRTDEKVIDPHCDCPACIAGYSRSYLHHLLRVGEVTGQRLCTLHNLRYYLRLMEDARAEILAQRYHPWMAEKLAGWGYPVYTAE
ncbi:tRNA guanosine(34) transglycosylase Tgt [Candidatus Peribacteria bacterium]|nr:tRNA guanosine(34) transglycosylase Tgt [Candidatus Peribacteria bacterium]